MSSVARVFTTHGNRFAVPVAAVDEVTATAPAERFVVLPSKTGHLS